MNDTFQVLAHCNYQELALALLETAKSTIQNYQEGLNYIIVSFYQQKILIPSIIGRM